MKYNKHDFLFIELLNNKFNTYHYGDLRFHWVLTPPFISFRISENPLGYSTLQVDLFKETFLKDFSLDLCKELSLKGLAAKSGSRTFIWRL